MSTNRRPSHKHHANAIIEHSAMSYLLASEMTDFFLSPSMAKSSKLRSNDEWYNKMTLPFADLLSYTRFSNKFNYDFYMLPDDWDTVVFGGMQAHRLIYNGSMVYAIDKKFKSFLDVLCGLFDEHKIEWRHILSYMPPSLSIWTKGRPSLHFRGRACDFRAILNFELLSELCSLSEEKAGVSVLVFYNPDTFHFHVSLSSPTRRFRSASPNYPDCCLMRSRYGGTLPTPG